MTSISEPDAVAIDRLRRVVSATLDLAGELDQRTLLTTALERAQSLLHATGSSFWGPTGDQALCQLALGGGADALRGTSVPIEALRTAAADGVLVAPIVVGAQTVGYLRVVREPDARGDVPADTTAFTSDDEAILSLLADSVASALRLGARFKANDRSGDLTLLQELSREIGSSLDLDRVLQTVVNIATRAVTFDLGALALYEGGKCDIRAVAGASAVDSGTDAMQDLAFRAAWAAGTGEAFYLSDREAPGSDTERIFLQFFGSELESAGMNSGLYLPLRDEEGIVGILLLEAKRAEFASAREREIASILASQATLAIRNAKLYSQVPLAEALGAISAKRQAFFAIPRRRRALAAGIVLGVIALLTLIRWPLRVPGEAPVFRPTAVADVRALVDGTVDRVLVREGAIVAAGDPIARLRDVEVRAARASAEAALQVARRSAALAASRGDAAEEQRQQLLAESARQELALRDDELAITTLRAPVGGMVLSSRPERLVDTRLAAGAALLQLGRVDTLEIEFSVEQQDITRVRVGDEVRIRLDAMPQQTFSGRVSAIGPVPISSSARGVAIAGAAGSEPGAQAASAVRYPVRALVPNTDALIKPGMLAHARVLTAPESVLGRLLRKPVRVVRLLWWRMWSWL